MLLHDAVYIKLTLSKLASSHPHALTQFRIINQLLYSTSQSLNFTHGNKKPRDIRLNSITTARHISCHNGPATSGSFYQHFRKSLTIGRQNHYIRLRKNSSYIEPIAKIFDYAF